MRDEIYWLKICQHLTLKFPDIIFWKHVESGLNGIGDIDTFATKESSPLIAQYFSTLAVEVFQDVRSIVACDHLPYAILIYIARESVYPVLNEFDIGWEQKRFGWPCLTNNKLLPLSEINQMGIRAPTSGAQAVILLILYGFNCKGKNRLKDNDYLTITVGCSTDFSNAMKAVKIILPLVFHNPMNSLLKNLGSVIPIWDLKLSRKIWFLFLFYAFIYHIKNIAKFFDYLLICRRQTCDFRKILHNHNRVVQGSIDIDDWTKWMSLREKILFFKK